MPEITFRPFEATNDGWLMWKNYDDYAFPDGLSAPRGTEARKQEIDAYIQERVGADNWRHWIMEIDGEVAGMVSWSLYRANHPDGRKDCYVAEIVGIDVIGPMRGKGYGRELLRHAIRQTTDDGCDILTAWVHKDNVASRGMFTSLAFVSYPSEEDGKGRVYYEHWLTS